MEPNKHCVFEKVPSEMPFFFRKEGYRGPILQALRKHRIHFAAACCFVVGGSKPFKSKGYVDLRLAIHLDLLEASARQAAGRFSCPYKLNMGCPLPK